MVGSSYTDGVHQFCYVPIGNPFFFLIVSSLPLRLETEIYTPGLRAVFWGLSSPFLVRFFLVLQFIKKRGHTRKPKQVDKKRIIGT